MNQIRYKSILNHSPINIFWRYVFYSLITNMITILIQFGRPPSNEETPLAYQTNQYASLDLNQLFCNLGFSCTLHRVLHFRKTWQYNILTVKNRIRLLSQRLVWRLLFFVVMSTTNLFTSLRTHIQPMFIPLVLSSKLSKIRYDGA